MLRDDILISACVYNISPDAQGAGTLERLAQNLGGTFRYWEILLAIPADAGEVWIQAFHGVPNVRLLRLRQGLGSYRQRTVLATEAIGDVVLIASADELDVLDICGMILDGHRMNSIVIGDRGKSTLLDAVFGVAGNSSGFHVNARFMQTIALPRGLLTRILNHPEQQLALRFPPRDHSIPIELYRSQANSSPRGHRHKLNSRLQLAHRLIVSSSPNVLLALSIASAFTALGGLIFLIYVVLIWIFHTPIQPGWVTTSAALAGSATFMGLVGLGLSTGMQKIINLLGHEERDDILEEIGNINVYSGINQDLNVHYDRGGAASMGAILAPADPKA